LKNINILSKNGTNQNPAYINQIINSSNNKHAVNQNNIKRDILGLNTDRQNITPVKLIDNNKIILNINNVNEFYSLSKNMNSNINNIDRNVYSNIKLNNISANKPVYINPYNK